MSCKLGLEGIVSKRKELDLPLRPFAELAQDEEPGLRSGEAQSDHDHPLENLTDLNEFP